MLATQRRSLNLDTLRGIAILTMIADHVIITTGYEHSPLRLLTRISMPLFFLISGHLVRRVNTERLIMVALIGLALGQFVGWIDAPNVLVIYACGVPLIAWARERQWALAMIVLVALTFFANGFWHVDGYFNPLSLFGIMALGAMIHRTDFPQWSNHTIAKVGQYPLTVYVGHILLLTTMAGMW